MNVRTLIFAALTSAGAVVVACSDDPTMSRPAFDMPDAGPDAAILPPPPADAGPDSARDAGEKRDPFDPADEPVVCAGSGPCAKQLVAGRDHFCALMSDGTVRCWGADDYGALGKGAGPKGPAPAPDGGAPPSPVSTVAGLAGATQISASDATTCARLTDGTIHCWGRNTYGQLGLDAARPSFDEFPHATPAPVALGTAALRVDVGPRNACALLVTGKVSCWGTNERAQLARAGATLDYVMGPGEAALGPLSVASVSAGSSTLLALTTAGLVVSWGAVYGDHGVVGGRMSSISPDPVPNGIGQLKNVTSLATSASLVQGEGGPLGLAPLGPFPPPPQKPHAHACAIASGEVYCWGRSDTGALCTGLPDAEQLPAHAPIKGKAWPQQLAVGDEITCARMTDGSVQCCGGDARGRLGTGKTEPFSPLFAPVESFKGHAVQVATSNRAVCALVQGGSVECWGSNASGELGLSAPDETAHPSPSKVSF